MNIPYVFDTSAFIEAWYRYFPPDMSGDVWDVFALLIGEGKMICPREVMRELEKQTDGLYHWVKTREDLLVRDPTVEVQECLKQIVNKYPRLLKAKPGRHVGDPWVIAHAVVEGGSVVTYEQPITNPNSSEIKIPNVCESMNVEWCQLPDVLRQEGWRITLSRL